MKKVYKRLITLFIISLMCLTPLFSSYASSKDITGGIYCPVLTYHRLTTDPSQSADWTVTAEKFEKDIKTLLDNGYTPIYSSDLIKKDKVIGLIPEKPVIIQFDDGYSSVYDLAFPILKKYNVKAEVYIITDYTFEEPTENKGNMFLGWKQLSEMEASGLMMVGLHGKNHLPVTGFESADVLKSDFNAAWNTINARLGNHERCYVYPRGQFNQSTIDTLNKNGAAVQFIWIWDMLPSYMGSAVGRVNVSGSTDVMKAISTYEYLYKLNCKK